MTVKNKVPLKTNIEILAIAAMVFIGTLVETSLNVTFPHLSKELGVSLNTIQWLTTGYLLVFTILTMVSAFVLKRFNGRQIFFTIVASFTLGDVLCLVSGNFTFLLIGRLFQAVATGLALPMLFHVIFTTVPRVKAAVYAGFGSMICSLAPALGPTYGGLLEYTLGWRYIFLFVLPLILLAFLAGWKCISVKAEGTTKRFDFVALIFMSVCFLSFVLASNQLGEAHIQWLWFAVLIVVGIIALILFLYTNGHGNSEIVSFAPLHNISVTLDALNYFILMFIDIAITFVIPIYAEVILGANPLEAGFILLPGSIIGSCFSPVSGWIYDRIGAFLPILSGLVIVTLATASYVFFQSSFTIVLMGVIYCCINFGINCAFANSLTNANEIAGPAASADLNSIMNMSQLYAGTIGTSIAAAIISFNQHRYGGSHSFKGNFVGGRWDFMMFAGMAVLALLLGILNWYLQRKKN